VRGTWLPGRISRRRSGGGAAASAGLLFLGLSLNLSDVLAYPGVPGRAAATLGLTVTILVASTLLVTPGQPVGASLAAGAGGGLYWVTAAVATGFLSATANPWVLLVEIKR
jgi:modulator of FtsH protease